MWLHKRIPCNYIYLLIHESNFTCLSQLRRHFQCVIHFHKFRSITSLKFQKLKALK